MVNPKFAAVQYALLGSLVMLIGSLGRAELGTFIETNGYHDFFIVTVWIGNNDVLIGATSLGWTEHVGVLRGLVQGRVKLGHWRDTLLQDPTKLMQAYLSCAQSQDAWASLAAGSLDGSSFGK